MFMGNLSHFLKTSYNYLQEKNRHKNKTNIYVILHKILSGVC
jgi:hypothetical protein